jgi:hypothetical protein
MNTDATELITAFAPDACTLPTAERPLRVAEFDDLFAAHLRWVERRSPTRLTLSLDGDPATEATARDLTERESECCSFFAFTVTAAGSGRFDVDVAVPDAQIAVLDGLERLADAAIGRNQGGQRDQP